ncbi:GNAT superfamily N-acetyltransferase [Thermocatellispora tengchongensis]|uniref:GNAT superfamily N-acetyltransferase n=1 Tax=Thermocatellispora tengchongensis TaxID=1073253 RepID=A0A840PJ13_9ACTN|nr:GNAT family N-acetyltransferase [Thermocatellispora tengchongensis]MBB5137087.1 GNAT superfamily N-acetyltransferase [Thermocatellispora tengchongensis]
MLHTTTAPAPAAPVRLRPLLPGETGPVLEVFDGLSPRSRYLRFLAPMPRLPGPVLRVLTDVDHDRHVAYVAHAGAPGHGPAIGIGRYHVLPRDPATADLSLAVIDPHQRRGVGRMLLRALTDTARARGLHALEVTMSPQNHAILRLIHPVRPRLSDGLYQARIPLT